MYPSKEVKKLYYNKDTVSTNTESKYSEGARDLKQDPKSTHSINIVQFASDNINPGINYHLPLYLLG